MSNSQKILSLIPSVNELLKHPKIEEDDIPKPLLLEIIREVLDQTRIEILQNGWSPSVDELNDEIIKQISYQANFKAKPSLKPVVNATGIILHTGLGRAPLSRIAKENLTHVIDHYCNLELNLETGKRGSRTTHAENLICLLTGAESAAVVNNNAAAVFLALNTFAFGKEAIISRGQLVEIGGSFRIPDVMEKSGAIMVEVGTTNKTHVYDFKNGISGNTGAILQVHQSNYRIMGFTKEVPTDKLAKLAQQHNIPLIHDLGGGVLVNLEKYGLPPEPVAGESVKQGADITTFSGDKILGGPQCGILIGAKKYIDPIKKNPLMRALRCDKMVYAVLEATLRLFLDEPSLLKHHLVSRMLTLPIESIDARAKQLIGQIDGAIRQALNIAVKDSASQTGSGALPLEEIPSKAISIYSDSISTKSLAALFRRQDSPILGYIQDDRLFFDMRTIQDNQIDLIADTIRSVYLEITNDE